MAVHQITMFHEITHLFTRKGRNPSTVMPTNSLLLSLLKQRNWGVCCRLPTISLLQIPNHCEQATGVSAGGLRRCLFSGSLQATSSHRSDSGFCRSQQGTFSPARSQFHSLNLKWSQNPRQSQEHRKCHTTYQ